LNFGFRFNQALQVLHQPMRSADEGFRIIRWLPPNLTALHFGYQFDQIIEKDDLPSTLKQLRIRGEFNFKFWMPDSVIDFTLEGMFLKEMLKEHLSINLRILILGNDFVHPIHFPIPTNLLYLEFGNFFGQKENDMSFPHFLSC
jgi:hypothetical protein